jgi:hypothetical protein
VCWCAPVSAVVKCHCCHTSHWLLAYSLRPFPSTPLGVFCSGVWCVGVAVLCVCLLSCYRHMPVVSPCFPFSCWLVCLWLSSDSCWVVLAECWPSYVLARVQLSWWCVKQYGMGLTSPGRLGTVWCWLFACVACMCLAVFGLLPLICLSSCRVCAFCASQSSSWRGRKSRLHTHCKVLCCPACVLS